jgi:Na+/melibiose symporter-like transporter
METWVKMDVKQKFAIVTAVVAFIAGWGLTIAGFIIPPKGEVSDSVMWILGQALVYTASVLGIGMYFNNELVNLRRETRRYIRDLEKEKEEGQDEEGQD